MVVPRWALLTSPVGAGLALFGLRSFTVNDPSESFPSPPPPSKTAWVAFLTRFQASRDSRTAYASSSWAGDSYCCCGGGT